MGGIAHHLQPTENGTVLQPRLFKRQDADHALRRGNEIRNDGGDRSTGCARDRQSRRTNKHFDRAHLQKAAIVPWRDNATIFDALVEGKADLMITDAIETQVRANLHPGVLCLSSERAIRPFGTRPGSLGVIRSSPPTSISGSTCSNFGRASGDPRAMDDPLMHSTVRRALKGATGRAWSEGLEPPIFVGLAATATLLDGDNSDFAAIHLHGLLTDLLFRTHTAGQAAPHRRWIHRGDPPRPRQLPETLAATVSSRRIVTWEPNAAATTRGSVGVRLRDRAGNTFAK